MRSGFVGLIALVCGCGRIGFDREADLPTLRKPITITAGSVSLADYPLAVIDTGDADLAAGASSDDLAFVAADGVTPLAYEIESYDAGSLVAWVRVPVVTGTETIYLTYGGPAHVPPDPALVWPGMLGVWHFAGAGPASDSTSHAHTFDSMQPPASVAGIAGGARSFDGTNTLAIADPPDGSLDMGERSFSMSLWVFVTQPAGMFDNAVYKGGSSDPLPGYDVEIGTGDWRLDIGDGVQNVYPSLGVGATHEGAWVQLAAVIDRSTQQLTGYVNGAAVATIDVSAIGSIDSPDDLQLGTQLDPYRGLLDELRLYDHALAPDWIMTEYVNLASPGQLVSVGPAERATTR